MEGETSWVSNYYDTYTRDVHQFNKFLELDEELENEEAKVSLNSILPDDLIEKILSFLPIPSIFRAGSVCKKWNEIVTSKRWIFSISNTSSQTQKPWYYMFPYSDEPIGFAYDPDFKKWYAIDLPKIERSNWCIASSCGLLCFMDNDTNLELYVCNPITKKCRTLSQPSQLPDTKISDYTALAISVKSRKYNVSIVKSKQQPGNFFQWNVSVSIYDSETMRWNNTLTEVFTGWRGGGESVICNGVLYFLIYSTGSGAHHYQHGLIAYDIVTRSKDLLKRHRIEVPCALTCGRLMNLKERLVMVGGIGKIDRPDIIKGIGIWALIGKEWEEIARMPHRIFQGFGECDEVFASSGIDDLLYIQSYGSPALLVFDMKRRLWKWSGKCPVTKKFPIQIFSGFCFEPRLEIAP